MKGIPQAPQQKPLDLAALVARFRNRKWQQCPSFSSPFLPSDDPPALPLGNSILWC